LWDLFMSNPEIRPMMDAIGFYDSPNSLDHREYENAFTLFPNPAASHCTLRFKVDKTSVIQLDIYDLNGKRVQEVIRQEIFHPGTCTVSIHTGNLDPGVYLIRVEPVDGPIQTKKLMIH
ncbi:MAG TPA: T9SS type A sorting domain-containing protein, partial [Bacteroides sp.]|nr:T9SS type A sorting domain-containing protein [Bacteroides sp.]